MRVLAGDIGGTNTRLGVFGGAAESPELLCLEILPSASGQTFSELLKQFLSKHPGSYRSACFGIAGPVRDGVCETPNLPWVLNARKLTEEFALPAVTLINDLQANAEGVQVLKPTDFISIQEGQRDPTGSLALVSAGTGLGMAGVMRATKDGFLSLPSEGGHADFAPRSPDDIPLFEFLYKKFGRVSYERILSGPGLKNIYEFLVEVERKAGHQEVLRDSDSGPLITKLALSKEDPTSVDALKIFVSYYGSVAGNVALQFLSLGGLFLGGGIAPRIASQLQSENFLKAFLDKGRLGALVKDIPVKIINNDKTALLGTAHVALKTAHKNQSMVKS